MTCVVSMLDSVLRSLWLVSPVSLFVTLEQNFYKLIGCINCCTWQISLLVLSFWSFHFASLCSFGLLAYVGYILYAFPSMFRLQQLNGLLLVFILLWAASTYIFNVALTASNNKSRKVQFLVALRDLNLLKSFVVVVVVIIILFLSCRIWRYGKL